MHYVKLFNINGVDTKQVACIELQAPPNAATEGAVGVLGMDMSSPTHEVYRCVAVNGSVYTWELLSAGMSIVSARITKEGATSTSFAYEDLKIPTNYLIKSGDLILDSDGYLYQVSSIGGDSCNATYCGTHLSGAGASDKDYRLVVEDGTLRLVTENGNVLSEIDFLTSDEKTIHRDSSTGKASVMAIRTIDGGLLHIFVGTQAEYEVLTEAQKQNLFAIITDDTAKEDLENEINGLENEINGLENEINGLENEINGLKDGSVIAKKAASLNIGTPTLNTAKELTENGYHIIRLVKPVIGTDGSLIANMCYVFFTYWKADDFSLTITPSVATTYYDGVGISIMVQISNSGGMSVYEQPIGKEVSPSETDKTSEYDIYTAKIGE